jgi:hypothetical protein
MDGPTSRGRRNGGKRPFTTGGEEKGTGYINQSLPSSSACFRGRPRGRRLAVRLKLAFDRHYIRNLGFWMDLRILMVTVIHVVKPYVADKWFFRLGPEVGSVLK